MSGGPLEAALDGSVLPSEGRAHSVARASHVFALVVREMLEEKPLGEVSPSPLTSSQFRLLKMLAMDGDHRTSQVANVLGVSPPAASKNITKLSRLGLVRRTPSTVDRRASNVRTSARGLDLVSRYEMAKSRRMAPLLTEFSARELEQLSGLLDRFSLTLIRHEEANGGTCFRCATYPEDDCPVAEATGGCPYDRFRASSRGAGHSSSSRPSNRIPDSSRPPTGVPHPEHHA